MLATRWNHTERLKGRFFYRGVRGPKCNYMTALNTLPTRLYTSTRMYYTTEQGLEYFLTPKRGQK